MSENEAAGEVSVKNTFRVLGWIFRLFWKHKPLYFAGLYLTTLVMNFRSLVNYYFFGMVMNFFYMAMSDVSMDMFKVGRLVMVYAIFNGMFALVDYWNTRLQRTMMAELKTYGRKTVLNRIKNVDFELAGESWDKWQKEGLENIPALASTYGMMASGLASLTATVVVGAYLGWYMPILVPVMILMTIPTIWLNAKVRKTGYLSGLETKHDLKMDRMLTSAFTSMSQLKLFQFGEIDDYLVTKSETINSQVIKRQSGLANRWSAWLKVTALVNSVVVMAGFVMVIGRYFQQKGLVGNFYFQLMVITNFQAKLQGLAGTWQKLAISASRLWLLFDVWHLATKNEPGEWQPIFPSGPKVEINNLKMVLKEKMVIRDLSLTIGAKEKTVIVVDSELVGKCLTEALIGTRKPDDGGIFVNGGATELMKRKWWYRNCQPLYSLATYIPQLTVLENVKLGTGKMEEVTDEDGVIALGKAGAVANIEALPLKFQQIFDERLGGVAMPPGLAYRVFLARQIIRQPPLLVICLPWSYPSSIATEILMRTKKYLPQSTIILVTGIMGVTRIADEIIMIKNGAVIEAGTKEELWQKRGLWAAWWQKAQEAQKMRAAEQKVI